MFNRTTNADTEELKRQINSLYSWVEFFIKQLSTVESQLDEIKKEIKNLSIKIEKE